jgi:hypothetical protein
MPHGVPRIHVALPPARAKPWWASRTLWFNALVAALAAAEAASGALQALLPADVWQLLTFALVVGNAALRVVTTQGLAARGAPPAPPPPAADEGPA